MWGFAVAELGFSATVEPCEFAVTYNSNGDVGYAVFGAGLLDMLFP